MDGFVSYYAGFCANENEIDAGVGELYCDCPLDAGICDTGRLIADCAITPIAAGSNDVTSKYVAVAQEPVGCEDPSELHPDQIFEPDLDLVPDIVRSLLESIVVT